MSDGSFSYTHNGSETLSDSFSYAASDGVLASTTVSVPITVQPVNDPPVGTADALEVLRGQITSSLSGGEISVLANDSDPEMDLLSATLVDEPQHGTLVLSSDGTFVYSQEGGPSLVDSFTYRASDGSAQSSPITVFITITPTIPVPSMERFALLLLLGSLASLGVAALHTRETPQNQETRSSLRTRRLPHQP
jgi:VCBS repeat-containing protein